MQSTQMPSTQMHATQQQSVPLQSAQLQSVQLPSAQQHSSPRSQLQSVEPVKQQSPQVSQPPGFESQQLGVDWAGEQQVGVEAGVLTPSPEWTTNASPKAIQTIVAVVKAKVFHDMTSSPKEFVTRSMGAYDHMPARHGCVASTNSVKEGTASRLAAPHAQENMQARAARHGQIPRRHGQRRTLDQDIERNEGGRLHRVRRGHRLLRQLRIAGAATTPT